jgi:hypothetical protein
MDNVGPDRIGVSVSGQGTGILEATLRGNLGGGFFFVLKGEALVEIARSYAVSRSTISRLA